jgi:hypothetical protein
MANITHKRGDTLEWIVTLTQNNVAVDITNWTITSQIRKDSDTLVASLTVTKLVSASGQFSLTATAAQTKLWDLGAHLVDIEFIDDTGYVVSSQTFTVQLVKDITYV